MSRIIIKNLPDIIDAAKLKEKFSEFGRVTDVQLKHTKDGKFRKFAFVGYEEEEEAKKAIKNFDKSFIGTSRIQVEFCTDLGDPNKPRAWSKYSSDSSVNMKKDIKVEPKESEKKDKKSKNLKKQIYDEELIEELKKHKDDVEFVQFLELHGKADKLNEIEYEEEVVYGNEENEKNEIENKKIALNKEISDMEYLQKKMKGVNQSVELKPGNKNNYFTIKVSNLPYKARKQDIVKMLESVHIDSLRIPKQKGIAYVGFKTEKQLKRALVYNKTFMNGHRINISEYKKKNDESDKVSYKWKEQEDKLINTESVAESGRIFVRNLPYTATEEDLREAFSKYGSVSELIYPVDRTTRGHKGYAIVTYLLPQDASKAFEELDGSVFKGRMLHLLPAKSKDEDEEINEDGSNFKKNKVKKLKNKSGSSHNWNSLFLDMNAIAEVIAEKYNSTKEEVLTGSNAAVRMALAETQLVSETKQFLIDNGVKINMFIQEAKTRSKTVILVKNLPAKTTVAEIRELFIKYGELGRVILPPSGISGIVEFLEPSEAKTAFRKLAYSKFKHLPLYLEWAPDDILGVKGEKLNVQTKEEIEEEDDLIPEDDTTLFVKNLHFDTTEENLKEHFKEIGKLAGVSIAKKKDPAKPGVLLSMGYGFVQFYLKSSLNEALKRLQGSTLLGHQLELKRSNRTTTRDAEIGKRKRTNMANQTGTKILVRNIPFQATAVEISEIFRTFGELKFVRLPKKLVGTGSHRGFAFVEFMTKQDAKRAMEALGQSTHLLGRRLVLEWAENEEDINQLMVKTAKYYTQEPKKRKKVDELMDEVAQEDDETIEF